MCDITNPQKKKYPQSIVSYGIIAYTRVKKNISFLIYQRRDNFEYMDFLRGMWATEEHARKLIAKMSASERYRLLNFTFDELWDDLWVNHDFNIYRDGKKKAISKYNMIQMKIPSILEDTNDINLIEQQDPPWGFPKGKKSNYRESTKVCALREFEEETRIPKEYLITSTLSGDEEDTLVEKFIGSNGKSYTTHYYMAKLDNNLFKALPEKIYTPQCIRQSTISEEAAELKLVSIPEIQKYLTSEKNDIIEKLKTMKYD